MTTVIIARDSTAAAAVLGSWFWALGPGAPVGAGGVTVGVGVGVVVAAVSTWCGSVSELVLKLASPA